MGGGRSDSSLVSSSGLSLLALGHVGELVVSNSEAGVGLVVGNDEVISDVEESLSGVELLNSQVRLAVLGEVLHELSLLGKGSGGGGEESGGEFHP